MVLQHGRNNQIMDVGWEAEWNSLSNDSCVAEKSLAGGSQKLVRESRKWWDRYLPYSLQYHAYSLTLYLDSTRRYYPNVTNDHPQTLSTEWDFRILRCTWLFASSLLQGWRSVRGQRWIHGWPACHFLTRMARAIHGSCLPCLHKGHISGSIKLVAVFFFLYTFAHTHNTMG